MEEQEKNQGINESLTMHTYYWYVLLKETLDILKTLPALLLLVHRGLGDLPGIVKLSFWVSSDFYTCLLCSRATSATIRKARLFLLHLLSHMKLESKTADCSLPPTHQHDNTLLYHQPHYNVISLCNHYKQYTKLTEQCKSKINPRIRKFVSGLSTSYTLIWMT